MNPFEYSLGLFDRNNKIKRQGEQFKELAAAYRGKPVIIPKRTLAPPPELPTQSSTWQWMLDFINIYRA